MMEYAWLNPLFPFISFVIVLALGQRMKDKGAGIATTMVGISFIQSVAILMEVSGGATYNYSINWIPETNINIGILINGISALMLVITTLISLLVHIFSIRYMQKEKGLHRYYSLLSLFTASMSGLVIANNYLGVFMFFELVGLCSYLLINFNYRNPNAVNAARKAFIITIFGDVLFLTGILLIFSEFGTFDFSVVHNSLDNLNPDLITIIALLVFFGAIGKSAQFPLHTWLPDAMEAPTTVSALLHSATMVAAGAYLIIRTYPLFMGSNIALLFISFIGAVSAIIAATMALVENDTKRILAYSTISQYGYIVLALGVGGIAGGIFHLMNHAFFKSLLFLAVGSMAYSIGSNDILRIGNSSKRINLIVILFLIGALANIGIPPFSGFFSKDEILNSVYNSGNIVLIFMVFFAIFLTSLYTSRMVFLAFFGKGKLEKREPYAIPKSMDVPLIILAFFTMILGFSGPYLEKLLGFGGKDFIQVPNTISVISLSISVIGIIISYLIYYKNTISAYDIRTRFHGIHGILIKKYYLDDLQNSIAQFSLKISKLLDKFDLMVVNGFVNLAGNISLKISNLTDILDLIIIDGIVNLISSVIVASSATWRKIQTGNLQTYLAFIIFGASLLIIIITNIR